MKSWVSIDDVPSRRVRHARGHPAGLFRALKAELDPAVLGLNVETASLRVAWWPAPDQAEFVFHYSEGSGFDCGWHREPNPHVDGLTHYQERPSPVAEYRYEPVSLGAETPPRILWTALDRLTERLGERGT